MTKIFLFVTLHAISSHGEIDMTAKLEMPGRIACEAAITQIEDRAGPIAEVIGDGAKIHIEQAECSEA
jgi:protein involved in temperature-dependent protein secretion